MVVFDSGSSSKRFLSELLESPLVLKFEQQSDPDSIDPNLLKFIYNIEWVNSNETRLHLQFDNPQYIT